MCGFYVTESFLAAETCLPYAVKPVWMICFNYVDGPNLRDCDGLKGGTCETVVRPRSCFSCQLSVEVCGGFH